MRTGRAVEDYANSVNPQGNLWRLAVMDSIYKVYTVINGEAVQTTRKLIPIVNFNDGVKTNVELISSILLRQQTLYKEPI